MDTISVNLVQIVGLIMLGFFPGILTGAGLYKLIKDSKE